MPKSKPDPMDIHVGQRVRVRRLMLELSQEKLAEALGLTFQQVQKYEKGVNRIGASRLNEIAKFLKCTVGWFYDGGPGLPKGETHIPDFVTAVLATREGIELCKHFSRLEDPKLRRRVVDLVEQIGAT